MTTRILRILGKKGTLIIASVLVLIMFVIVMFFVNPAIDGGDGAGVLNLQLSFKKSVGLEIVNSWGDKGVDNFRQWIIADYVYAFTYAWFFSSLILFLSAKIKSEVSGRDRWFVSLAFISGVLDLVENSMEFAFVSNPYRFSDALFFLHSVVALLKWIAVSVVVAYILFLWKKITFDQNRQH